MSRFASVWPWAGIYLVPIDTNRGHVHQDILMFTKKTGKVNKNLI